MCVHGLCWCSRVGVVQLPSCLRALEMACVLSHPGVFCLRRLDSQPGFFLTGACPRLWRLELFGSTSSQAGGQGNPQASNEPPRCTPKLPVSTTHKDKFVNSNPDRNSKGESGKSYFASGER